MNASEAGGDLALKRISLLFSCKCQLVSIRTTIVSRLTMEQLKTRSPPASLSFRGQVPKLTTVKWSICSENKKDAEKLSHIIRVSPSARSGSRLQYPSPIMAHIIQTLFINGCQFKILSSVRI